MLTPDQLHDYQQDMIDRLYERDHTLVIADMGAGKTAATLTAIAELLADGELSRVLVLAPLRVAAGVWHAEVDGWAHLQDLTVARAIGTAGQRTRALESRAQVVTMNYENLLWLIDRYAKHEGGFVGALGFDGLVMDEVSRMKGAHKSKRYKALRPYLRLFKWRAGLTGTPAPNGLLDLYGVAYVCDSGAALGRTFGQYRREHFIATDPNGWNWVPRPNAEAEIFEKLSRTAFVLDPRKSRVEPVVRDHVVRASDEATKVAQQLASDFIATVGDDPIDVANGGVLVNKLQQVAQGFLYVEDDDGVRVERLDTAKLDKCIELVESLDGQPVIIAYKYKADLDALRGAFPDAPWLGAGVSNNAAESAIAMWNKGELPVLLLHPASAGHGLNLQKGGHHMIWYGNTWSSEEYRQAVARIARQGQQRQVYVHRIVSDLSVSMHRKPLLIDRRIVEASSVTKPATEGRLVQYLLGEAA